MDNVGRRYDAGSPARYGFSEIDFVIYFDRADRVSLVTFATYSREREFV